MASSARVNLPTDLKQLLRQELEDCINQTAFGPDDSLLADRYFLEHITQADIAPELERSSATVCRRKKRIIERIRETAHRLGYL